MEKLSTLKMMQICDSLFPIGAFTLSNGLETFVACNVISNIEDLEDYIDGYLAVLPYNDLGVMILAYRLAREAELDTKDIVFLDNLSMALKVPFEVRNGSKKLCSRFLKLWDRIYEYDLLKHYEKLIANGECYGNHAIAVGLYAHENGLDVEEAAQIYAYSLVNAIVTNAVKTVPLSQIAGQKLLNDKMKDIEIAVKKALTVSTDELGVGGSSMDIYAMNHERMYSRLYMS